jgi:hypothetical protein
MAVQNAQQVYKIRGRVIINPSNLAIAYPYGGTAIGYTSLQAFRWGVVYELVRAEEMGAIIEVHQQFSEAFLAFDLLQPDQDALQGVFPAADGNGMASGPYGPRGNMAAINELLLAPLDSTARGLLIRRPILRLDEDAVTRFSGLDEAVYNLVAQVTPPVSGDSWQHRTLASMVL